MDKKEHKINFKN